MWDQASISTGYSVAPDTAVRDPEITGALSTLAAIEVKDACQAVELRAHQ